MVFNRSVTSRLSSKLAKCTVTVIVRGAVEAASDCMREKQRNALGETRQAVVNSPCDSNRRDFSEKTANRR